MITNIATVWVPVSDMGTSVAFYRDTLGLDVSEHDGNWSMVSAGEVQIGLNASEDPAGTGGAVIAFAIDGELERAVDQLKDRGVEFPGEISDHPWGRIATFNDPDGNDLQLYSEPR